MSINIGYWGTNYGTNNFASIDNRLIINTHNSSNAININTHINSTSNAIINYKNLFKTGVINNNFVIQNTENDNAIVLTNSNININNKMVLNNDIECKTLLNTSNNIINMTSNINIHLYNDNNFNIYNKNNCNLNLTFNNSNFTSYIDTYLKTLITNEIKPVNYDGTTGTSVKIYNAELTGVKIESFDSSRFFINNVKNTPFTGSSFAINRYYNLYNILEINTCNFNVNTSSNTYYNEPIIKHFSLNNYGMVGIGSKPPDAPLSISANYYDNPYVFKYTGTQLSDTFNITKDANVGIGTTNPLGILHINRNDDKYDDMTCNLSYNNIRNQPLLKLNIDYDSSKNNITTSNTEIIINSSNIIATNIIDYKFFPSINDNTVNTSQLTNNIYILNNELYSKLNNNINNIASIANNSSCNINYKTYKLNNYLLDNYFSGFDKSSDTGVILNYINNIYYPYNIFISEYRPDYKYEENTIIESGVFNSYTYKYINNYTYGILVMSKDTYDNGKYLTLNNLNNYTKITSNYYISTKTSQKLNFNNNGITSNLYYYQDVNFNLNIYLENNKIHKSQYTTSNIFIPSPAPDFLYLTSNNQYKASISHNGILSLGTKYPLNDSNYLLYIPEKSAYINNAEINSITTNEPSIIFNNKNLSDINNITSSNVNIIKGKFDNIDSSNIFTCNLTFNYLNIENITMNSSNVHLTNKISISSDPLDNNSILKDNSTLMKITVNNNIIKQDNNFKNSDGLVITNNNINTSLTSNINPSIAIYGSGGSYPLIKLSKNKIIESEYNVENTLNNYFIRLATKEYYSGGTAFLDHFEVCCDNIRDSENKINYYNHLNSLRTSTNILPSFIKHIKKYNLLCFGELNNICIKCDNAFSEIYNTESTTSPYLDTFTNSTNKISLGIPFKDTDLLPTNFQSDIEDWAQIFNNKICNVPILQNDINIYNKYNSNMLNIFGNTGIWSISGNNILKAKMNTQITGIEIIETGCDIIIGNDNNNLSANTNLNVYGGITSAYPINTYASSNLMIDESNIDIINPVEKIKNINAYSYKRYSDNSIRDIGLKAEQVQAQFPELVKTHNNNLTIDNGGMTAILIEAIKELKKQIDDINLFIGNI